MRSIRWALALLAVTVPSSRALAQGPSTATIQRASESVFRVLATGCSGGSKKDRLGTGFAVTIGSQDTLVTALHVVAGCSTFELQVKQQPHKATVKHVYLDGDVAELSSPTVTIPALPLGTSATSAPAPGAQLASIGFPGMPVASSNSCAVRQLGPQTIGGLLQSAAVSNALTKQGFPSISDAIINLEASFQPGESGAPVIDASGTVVGMANGNLKQGTMPYSWAFPASAIAKVTTSTHASPSPSTLSTLLIAEEVDPNKTARPLSPTGTLKCGARTFRYAGSQSLTEILATADPFAMSHINMALAYARADGQPVGPSALFSIYVDPVSGANFAVPAGVRLTQSGTDCVGADASNQIEVRVSTEAVPSFAQTGPPAMAFARRTIRSGEIAQDVPNFSTLPVARPLDQAWFQRWGFDYVDPQVPLSPTRGYMTFAYRAGYMLMIGMRLTARTRSDAFYPAIVGVYGSTFVL